MPTHHLRGDPVLLLYAMILSAVTETVGLL